MIKDIQTAFSNLFKTPLTHPYPQKQIAKQENFRGLIEYNEDACIFCLKCEKACPPQAILFTP
ncbi:MAG: 4Fe-4S binding protein, partial [Campylobacterota bacterium]